jgi:P-type E1-E2 ATPase
MTNDYSQVYVATDKEIVARFDIADMIKADSKRSIDKIKSLGVQVYMVTGDNQQVAKSIANQVGIDKVFASCLPQDKLKIVTDIQQRGIKVAFVGDGINDAPSLLQADIGIAIGGGLDIAKQSASISLVGHSLNNVYDALRLARNIQLNMRQNLYGSFIYNSIAISVAAGLFYPLFGVLLNPMIASITMSMSSLCVILNALRLRFVMT